eukprot:scaffold43110_cov30-Tisochrysis_lutea.AAC.1
MTPFFGMRVRVGNSGLMGKIDSTFGKSKFKVAFPTSLEPGVLAEACKGAKIYLDYKRLRSWPSSATVSGVGLFRNE